MLNLLRKSTAEAASTFLLIFIGCGSIMVAERFGTIPPFTIPLIFGLTVIAMIYMVGPISGAHMNPAVTLALAVTKDLRKREVLFYWLGQVIGAVVATFTLYLVLPLGKGYGATVPNVSQLNAVLLEVGLTFFLTYVVLKVKGPWAITIIGAAVALCCYVGGPFTGASMNPARSFGPALFENQMDCFWIYLVGPLTGAALAALFFVNFGKKQPKNLIK
jgi:MIP family channel proteins